MSAKDDAAINIIMASSYRRRHADSGPPFSGDLYLWLAHDQKQTIGGGRITAWEDARGGIVLSEIAGSGPAPVVVSGRTGGSFLGAQYLNNLALPAGLGQQSFTTFVRAKNKQSDLGAFGTVLTVENLSFLQQYSNTSGKRVYSTAGIVSSATVVYDVEEVYQARSKPAAIELRAGLGAWTSAAKSNLAGNATLLKIGMYGGLVQFYKGAIMDVLVYKRVLSDAEADAVVAWMATS